MKHITTILITCILCLNSTVNIAAEEPEWFKYFIKSLFQINKNYLEEIDKNNQLREKYNFKPILFDCAKNEKISFSIDGLDYFYFSFENRQNKLISGELNNAFFIDKKGEKYAMDFLKSNLIFGKLESFSDDQKVRWTRLRNGMYKVECNKQFVDFTIQTLKRNKQIRIDLVQDPSIEQKLIDLESKILRDYPESREADGFGQEIKNELLKHLLKNTDTESLADFYINNSHVSFRKELNKKKEEVETSLFLYKLRETFVFSERIENAVNKINNQQISPVILAIKDCQEQFAEKFPNAEEYLFQLKKYEIEKEELLKKLKKGNKDALILAEQYFATINEALLANPLLDFDEIILLKRDASSSRQRMPKQFGFPSLNSHNNTNIVEIKGDWHNSITRLTDLRDAKKLETVLNSNKKKLITDLELDFDGDHILFSMENDSGQWHVYETDIRGENITCITPDSLPDVNHFDACYLPNGDIVFTSDATYQGLPCEGGSRPMAVLYVIERKTGKIRQLTYEQDSDFCPTVLNNGRLMYLRWEYSDLPHYFSRILMSCNPDGTAQMEYYGSNSYFPNSYFYARPLPNHPTQVIGVVGGHHGITRSGRLMIIDPAKGRSEADGVVHEIPRRGQKVEPIIKDQLVAGVWPQFLHPYPLNDKYFLVSAKLNEKSLWGIYLVDVFDNMTLIKEIEGSALFDPIPVKKQPKPRIIPSRINKKSKEATVFLTDIYQGNGLKNIPRGEVKSLRLFAYHYAHIATGGHSTVGVESSWDIKRILGTVPVEKDGSALFTIPANTPISIQPLDSTGKALQIMRSWFVGMPGENVSCIGCHERTSQAPPNMFTMASRKAPADIETWQGNPRPFSFRYEVQPVLDKYCISCHSGAENAIPDLRKHDLVDMEGLAKKEYFLNDKAYLALHPFVRRPGPEGDIHLLKPMEYHAGTSELIQLLQRGHHGVEIEDKDWEKLYTWIDLNAPYRGKWSPPEFRDFDQDERRKYLSKEYANITIDPEAEYDSLVTYMEGLKVEPVKPVKKQHIKYEIPSLKEWPISDKAVRKKQKSLLNPTQKIELGNGEKINFAAIPEGKYIKGNPKGYTDERKPEIIEIKNSFYMSECEITNAQFALFDSTHNSRFIDQQWKDHTTPGYPANLPNQPVIRVSFDEALAFCIWLSNKLGKNVTLPTEDQWEWACRAGTATDFWFDSSKTNFAEFENLSDNEVRKFAVQGVNPHFIGDEHNKLPYYAFIPREKEVNDGNMIVAPVGSYKPNPWGLFDMHGNVAEWTSSSYQPTGESQDKFYNKKMKVVKGGSWRDRTKISTSGSKRYYLPYQKVYNVGFRVVIVEEEKVADLK